VAFRPRLAAGLAFLLGFNRKHTLRVIVKIKIQDIEIFFVDGWRSERMADIPMARKMKMGVHRDIQAGRLEVSRSTMIRQLSTG
jgi:hypothetical protein